MTENNTTQTSIYSQTLTEAKYLVNSGKVNPEPAKHLIHLRQQLKDRLRDSRLSDRPSSLLEDSCKKALKELQEAIKEVAPQGWDFEHVQLELYKKVRGDHMRDYHLSGTGHPLENNQVDGEMKPYQGDYYATIVFPWPMYKELQDEAEMLGISTSDNVVRLLKEQRLAMQMKPVFEFIEKQDQLNQKFSMAINPSEQEKADDE